MVTSITQRIAESSTIATIRETGPETAVETVDALRRGGVSTVEITVNTESILSMIRDVSESFAAGKVTIGAGTVFNAKTVRATILADAGFVTTPPFDEGVVEIVNRYDVPSLASIATSTGAVNAFETDADMVEASPAGTLRPRFISALGSPLGRIPTVPTGGVGLDNVDEFFDAGATTIGAGSSTVDTGTIVCGESGVIEVNVRVSREAVEAARSE